MSKKNKKATSENQEKETSMRFDRDWIAPIGKKGIMKQMEKRAKNAKMILSPKEQEEYDQIMAPKRLRRAQFRAAKKLQSRMTSIQEQGNTNASA